MKPLLPVAIPTRGTIIVETHHCLRNVMDDYPTHEEIVARRDVVEARNELARRIRSLPSKLPSDANLCEYVLWIDDDGWWWPGSVARAIEILTKRRDIAILCGYVTSRAPFKGPMSPRLDGLPWPMKGRLPKLVEVVGCSFHFVMMRRSVLDVVGDDPFDLAGASGSLGEDAVFCERARAKGQRIFCATTIPVLQVEADGRAFYPYLPTLRMRDLSSVDTNIDFAVAERERDEMFRNFRLFPSNYDARAYSPDVDRRSNEAWKKTFAELNEGKAAMRMFDEAADAARRGDPSALRKLAAAKLFADNTAIAKHGKKLREAGWTPDIPTMSEIRRQIRNKIERKGDAA